MHEKPLHPDNSQNLISSLLYKNANCHPFPNFIKNLLNTHTVKETRDVATTTTVFQLSGFCLGLPG